jgi:hypothetical protein
MPKTYKMTKSRICIIIATNRYKEVAAYLTPASYK